MSAILFEKMWSIDKYYIRTNNNFSNFWFNGSGKKYQREVYYRLMLLIACDLVYLFE